MDNNKSGRPSVLEQATETQIQELERQFAEKDRKYWNELAESYGWTDKQSEDVWKWFSQKEPTASDNQSFA